MANWAHWSSGQDDTKMSAGKPKTTRASSITWDPDATFILGIDIGTTSVKACLIDTATKSIAAIQAKDTQGTCKNNRNSY